MRRASPRRSDARHRPVVAHRRESHPVRTGLPHAYADPASRPNRAAAAHTASPTDLHPALPEHGSCLGVALTTTSPVGCPAVYSPIFFRPSVPIIRVFRARAKRGCESALANKLATSSVEVVQG